MENINTCLAQGGTRATRRAESPECLEVMASGLRDFFMSRNGADLERALRDLGWQKPWDADAALEAEYAFNRLFVGPDAPAAPPYSSIYLDKEPLLMGQSCMDVRALMDDMGLAVAHRGSEPEDHLACELELWLLLRRALHELQAGASEEHPQTELEAALHWLVNEHMGLWLPLFLNRAIETPEAPDSIIFALICLKKWLNACSYKEEK